MPPPAKQTVGGVPSNPNSLPTPANPQGPNYAFPNPANPTSTTSYAAVDFRKDFFFRRRHGALDWRKLQQVDLEKVVRTVDVDALQDNVEHITFADISEHDLAQLTDANFLQLFRMTQLIIEYLLNVQNFLLASAKKKEATYEQVVAELNATRAELAERTESERAARREAKYQKKIIHAYERNLGARWSELGGNPAGAVANAAPSKCGICGSVFVNHEFLVGHYRRRHPNEPLPAPTIVANATAATGKPAAEEKAQTTDLAAWKREMESALRAQILDQSRMRSALVPEETETSQRLAKLEATLSAVLNGNTVPISTAASPAGEQKESHVSGLRDDDGGERLSDDQANLKEYLRRQLFDLHEEIRTLKQQQQYHPHSHAHSHQPSPQLLADHLSPRSEAHASELMHRFRPTTLQPHAPTHPHHTHNIPHGHGGVVPRHVPGQSPSSSQQLQPHPPATSKAVPVANADSATMQALRTSLLKHHDVKYQLFPDLPGLLARFIQSEQELVSNLNSFAVISNTLALQGEGTGSGIEAVESELKTQGYDHIQPDIESFVDEYVKSHYKRPVELLEAHRALAAKEAKNEAMGAEQRAKAEKERKQREQWAAQLAEMESQRSNMAKSRQDEARRAALAREENLRIAQREAQESADKVQRARDQNTATLSSVASPSPSPAPSPLPAVPVTTAPVAGASVPGTPATGPVGAPTPAGAVRTPSVKAANTPLAVPSKLPSAVPSPLMPSNSAIALAPSAALENMSLPPATSSSSTSGVALSTYNQQKAAPVAFSNNPNILNPSATANSSLPPQVPRQGSLATKQPVGILKKTNTVRSLVSGVDADDDDDFEEEKVPYTPPISSAAAAAAAASAPTYQRAASLSKSATTAPLPAGSPMAVPVPIPARPNKAAVAASLAANTPTAGGAMVAAGGVKPVDSNFVEPFNVAQENASRSVSMTSIPSGFSTPSVVPDNVLVRRNETRRLGGDNLPEKDPMDDSLDLLKRDHRASEGAGSNFMASALAQINAGNNNRRGSGTDVAGIPPNAEKIEYEHSTARRDQEGGEEDGGLDVYARDREELEARNRDNVQAFGEDDVHHFSPPVTSPVNRTRAVGGTGRLHSDDEGDTPVQPVASRFANAGVGAPQTRTRQVSSPTHAPSATSRMLQPPVNRSAQFSVTNSSDWKSDNDILDDDVEEVFA